MKTILHLSLLVVALAETITATTGALSPSHQHPRLANRIDLTTLGEKENRQLQVYTCADIRPRYESFLESDYGTQFDCSCASNKATCTSSESFCCGTVCVSQVTHTAEWGSDGTAMFEEICITYESGTEVSNNNTICHASTFCSSEENVCSCEGSINNEACQACDVCQPNLFSAFQPLAVIDCSNIPGFESLNHTCSDIDSPEAREELDLQFCSGSPMYATALVLASIAAAVALF